MSVTIVTPGKLSAKSARTKPKQDSRQQRQKRERELDPRIVAWGAERGIAPAQLVEYQIQKVLSQDEVSALVGLGFRAPAGGFVIPYRDAHGNWTKAFRIRLFDYELSAKDRERGKKPLRYLQVAESNPAIYFPVGITANLDDSAAPIFITEGEAKAICATLNGFPCIGLGGIWSYGQKKRGLQILPPLENATKWEGKKVYLVPDSDIDSNPDVGRAIGRLAELLVKRGAHVFVVNIPADAKRKMGLDDYIVTYGAKAFGDLVLAAEEWSISKEVHELRTQYRYIRDISVMARIPDNHEEMTLYKVGTFINEVEANRKVMVGDKWCSAARMFVEGENRPEAKRLTYAPGQPVITAGDELNMWQPGPVIPKPGDTALFTELMEFLFPDPMQREWLLCWMAYPLQYPGTKLFSAVVLYSPKQGVGKTLLAEVIRKCYGKWNVAIVDSTALKGEFNEWAKNKQLIIGEEITGGEGRRLGDRFKHLISGKDIRINIKNVTAVELPNRANFIFTTNHSDAFYLEGDDRRFAVFELPAPKPAEWYKPYDVWVNADEDADVWTPAVLDYLLRKDLSKFNPRAHAPWTKAKARMIEYSRSQMENWVQELKANPDAVPLDDYSPHQNVLSLHTAEELLKMFGEKKHFSTISLTRALRAAGFEMACKGEVIRMSDERKHRLWIVRNVDGLAQGSSKTILDLYNAERGTIGKSRKFAKSGNTGAGLVQ